MMMSDLPADLVEEILSRVPAKSLKRLRYTCKQWNALFKNRVFTENHFRKAAKQSMVLLLKNYRVCLMSVNLNVVAPSIEFKGELSLEYSHSNSEEVDIVSVSHCDGLLLCTTKDNELVVWNPCLEETRWIQHKSDDKKDFKCALGYQNNNSRRSYKILRYWRNDNYFVRFEIYEFSSDSWRVFDNDSMYYGLINPTSGVSLKGNTYWLILGYSNFVLSFDYTKERFKRLYLPPNLGCIGKEVLSIVREEQLSLLIPCAILKMEIWMTKNIDTEATLSWWKYFTVDMRHRNRSFPVRYGFLIDEEKRVVVCCNYVSCYGYIVDIIGEDDEYKTELLFEASRKCSPFIFNYAPSLIQIQREKNRR